MRTKKLIRKSCFFFAFAMVGSLMLHASANSVSHFGYTLAQNTRLHHVFEDKFQETVIFTDDGYSNSIGRVKEVKDFAGNAYLVVEAEPAGYMIYNVESGIFSERSATSVSPYAGYESQLYYAGIGNYFCKDGNTYYHTLDTGLVYTADQVQSFFISSTEQQKYYKAKTDTNVLNYIQMGTEAYQEKRQSNLSAALSDRLDRENKAKNLTSNTMPESGAVSQSTRAYFSFYDWFNNLQNCGQIPGGKCGYIGLAMIWAAHDRYNAAYGGPRLVDDNCYTNNYQWLRTVLPNHLYDLAPKSSTTSIHIEKVSKLYASERGVSVKHSNWLAPIANWGSVANIINSTGYPVEIFGNVNGVNNHAVVAYYVNPAKTFMVVHMGYNGQTNVNFDGIIGSYYYLDAH